MNDAYLILKYGSIENAIESWVEDSGSMPDEDVEYVCNYIIANKCELAAEHHAS